ncbi:hypothetical protein B296_00031939 [Ensete ventricosum]|uniref:Uncharacterized protein n=1 Tax=Ensete ventricosum TaxID=4639 RepID=A0A426Y848_ENSVE|nr:hypothetical protein B296_00031939 [Ensete ventricosum]
MAMPISSSSVARIATKPFDGLVRSASRSCSIGKIHSDRRTRHPSIRSALITEPDAFEVGKFVGSYGFMNITRSPRPPPLLFRTCSCLRLCFSDRFAVSGEYWLKQLRGISNTFGLAFSNSYSSFQSGGLSNANVFDEFSPGYSSEDMERLRVQDVGEGQVKIRCFC